MENEEQIMGLMAIAEEQQEAIRQLIEKAEDDRQQAINTRLETVADNSELVKMMLRGLQQESRKALNWHKTATHIATIASAALIIFGLLHLYVDHQTDKLAEINQTIRQLETANADIRQCEREGKTYTCIRVMKSWGGYGDGDIFIIDPK